MAVMNVVVASAALLLDEEEQTRKKRRAQTIWNLDAAQKNWRCFPYNIQKIKRTGFWWIQRLC